MSHHHDTVIVKAERREGDMGVVSPQSPGGAGATNDKVCIGRKDKLPGHLCSMLKDLYYTRLFPDVTLCCDGEFMKAHQMILAMNSGYFRRAFQNTNAKHPVVCLRDIGPATLNHILRFLYTGSVIFHKDEVTTFVKAADQLEIYWDLTERPSVQSSQTS